MNVEKSDRIEEALALLGRQGAYRVLRALLGGPMRFGELQQATRLLPRTLSLRLKEMGAVGWVERWQYPEVPPRVEYRLTQASKVLEPVLEAIEAWASKRA